MGTLTDPLKKGWDLAAPELAAIVRDVLILAFLLGGVDVFNALCQFSLLLRGDPEVIHNVERVHKWVVYSGLVAFAWVAVLRTGVLIWRETRRAKDEIKK
jgi:hypothetical protein